MEDRQIVKLLWDRSEDAVEALTARFGLRLYRTALNILGNSNDAQECVNDTYLALWNTIPPEKPDPLAAFVHRVGRNIALKRLRANTALKRGSAYNASLDELAECVPGASLDEQIDARMLGHAIDTFLNTVSKDSRILFLRRYWFGDSVREIASALKMSENAVNVRLSRTRSQLRSYLLKEGYLHE